MASSGWQVADHDDFRRQVRDALHHLYDYHYLENHPLALQYWPEEKTEGPGRAHRFNRLLLESIEELNPPGEVVADRSRARFYSILVSRYVEERPLPEILRELGYSRSQFFREQQKAITMLASILREKLRSQVPSPAWSASLLEAEADRVLSRREAVDPAQVLPGVLELVSHLAGRRGVSLVCDLVTGLPRIYGSRTVLRQVLLKGLSDLISQPDTRQVCIHMHCVRERLVTELIARTDAPAPRDRSGKAAPCLWPNLEPVRRLVEAMGGHWLGIRVGSGMCTYSFDFPVDRGKTLLVVEDNEGIVRVFEGYLAGYGYQVVGATTGDEALRLARELSPAAIPLDIMMPNQDGWEILQALKSDPVTRSIPVIICSVLEDPELAHSLGAAAYLQKPITQRALLEVLSGLPEASCG